jgi:hypothetical protein
VLLEKLLTISSRRQPFLVACYFQRSADLHDPQQVQYDKYDGNYEQGMNPTACLREAWNYASTEKAEQPQDHQNYDNSPQHEISPF